VDGDCRAGHRRRSGVEINKTLENPEQSLTPAMKGRNHAATPVEHQPRER
jgi:hypothetical protein